MIGVPGNSVQELKDAVKNMAAFAVDGETGTLVGNVNVIFTLRYKDGSVMQETTRIAGNQTIPFKDKATAKDAFAEKVAGELTDLINKPSPSHGLGTTVLKVQIPTRDEYVNWIQHAREV